MISTPTACPICRKRSHRGRKLWDDRLFCGEACKAIAILQGPSYQRTTLDNLLRKYYAPEIKRQLTESQL